MTALAYEQWAAAGPRENARPHFPLWAAASVLVHGLVIAWILAAPEPKPLSLSDRAVQDDRPPVQVVVLPYAPTAAPRPDADVATDRPSNALPPPVRKLDEESDIAASPDAPPAGGFGPVEPRALEEFVRRNERAERETAGGPGSTWTTCSRLSPERRLLEPACDGLMLRRGEGPGVAASLQAPDAETLAAIAKLNPPPTAQDDADAIGNNDRNEDRSYRNPVDDSYGPLPWE